MEAAIVPLLAALFEAGAKLYATWSAGDAEARADAEKKAKDACAALGIDADALLAVHAARTQATLDAIKADADKQHAMTAPAVEAKP